MCHYYTFVAFLIIMQTLCTLVTYDHYYYLYRILRVTTHTLNIEQNQLSCQKISDIKIILKLLMIQTLLVGFNSRL